MCLLVLRITYKGRYCDGRLSALLSMIRCVHTRTHYIYVYTYICIYMYIYMMYIIYMYAYRTKILGKKIGQKIQFHHWHPWLSGKASALDMPRTLVRLLASAKFFIYSVASILQCSPCEVLEGPISTRVGII